MLGTVAAVMLAGGGCREKIEQPKVLPLEGKVTKIDTRAGAITVRYFNEKQQKEMTDTGAVNENTEIVINGALASLADIRVGELVRGQVVIERDGQERRARVLKISVDRPVESEGEQPTPESPPTAPPAPAPSEKPAP